MSKAVNASSNLSKAMSAKHLVVCAAAIALAYVASYVKLFSLPFGGSVTLFSMLFIALVGYWYGAKIGILTGFVYGLLQFFQEPYMLNLLQVGCDYLFAFSALGVAGIFKNKKNGLIKGYLFAIFLRGVFHSLGGYLFWMSYMPESFPSSLAALYPIIYNYSYILAEGIVTVIVLMLPPVKVALSSIKKIVL